MQDENSTYASAKVQGTGFVYHTASTNKRPIISVLWRLPEKGKRPLTRSFMSGAEGIRTPDPLTARQTFTLLRGMKPQVVKRFAS